MLRHLRKRKRDAFYAWPPGTCQPSIETATLVGARAISFSIAQPAYRSSTGEHSLGDNGQQLVFGHSGVYIGGLGLQGCDKGWRAC